MKKTFLFSILLGLLPINPGFSEPSNQSLTNLNINQALEAAHKNNSRLKVLEGKILINEAEINGIGIWSNPILLSDNGLPENTYRLGLQKTFDLGFESRFLKQKALISRKVSQNQITKAIMDLDANVKDTYTELYSIQEQIIKNQDLLHLEESHIIIPDDISLQLEIELLILNYQKEISNLTYEKEKLKNTLSVLLNIPFKDL